MGDNIRVYLTKAFIPTLRGNRRIFRYTWGHSRQWRYGLAIKTIYDVMNHYYWLGELMIFAYYNSGSLQFEDKYKYLCSRRELSYIDKLLWMSYRQGARYATKQCKNT